MSGDGAGGCFPSLPEGVSAAIRASRSAVSEKLRQIIPCRRSVGICALPDPIRLDCPYRAQIARALDSIDSGCRLFVSPTTAKSKNED